MDNNATKTTTDDRNMIPKMYSHSSLYTATIFTVTGIKEEMLISQVKQY